MSDDIQNNGLVAIDPGAFRILTEAVIKVGRFVAGERRVSRHTTHGVFLSQPDRHELQFPRYFIETNIQNAASLDYIPKALTLKGFVERSQNPKG